MENQKVKKNSQKQKTILLIILSLLAIGSIAGIGFFAFRLGKSQSNITPTPTPTVSKETLPSPTPTTTEEGAGLTPTEGLISPTPTMTTEPSPTPTPTTTPQADLQIHDYEFNHPPVKDEPFTVSFDIHNAGDSASGPFWWTWWSSWAKEVCRERIENLDPHTGATATCTHTYAGWSTYTTRA